MMRLITGPGGCDNLPAGLPVPDAYQSAQSKPCRDRGFAVASPDAENGIGGVVSHRAFNEAALKGGQRHGIARVRAFWNAQAMHEAHSSFRRGQNLGARVPREN
jgi:hypothetical protein